MTWADIILEVAAPQVQLAVVNALLDEALEGFAQAGYLDRGVFEHTMHVTLPGRIQAIEITGRITI